ncbi:MAG: carboxypeptidase-like regulatory domain-containing protein [Myxococcales bacterium]
MSRAVCSLPLCIAIVALPALAHAQQAAADALFDSARAAMAKGDFATACEQFRASDKLDPAVGTELNLADCEEQRGRLATAWELYRTVEEKLSAKDERIALAHARAESLAARVPKLTLQLAPGAPKDSTVRDGQVELGSAAFGIALPLEPGAHELIVSAPGYEARSFPITLSVGQAQTLVVSPGRAVHAAPPAAPPAIAWKPDAEPKSGSETRSLGFALGGVGVAGLGVGAVAGILVLGKQHTVDAECRPDKSCSAAGVSAASSGHTLQVVSNVGWVVGAAALGAGAYFLLTSGPSTAPKTSLSVSSTVAGGQLALTRSW